MARIKASRRRTVDRGLGHGQKLNQKMLPSTAPTLALAKSASEKRKDNRKRGPTPELITSTEWSNKNRSIEDRVMKELKRGEHNHADARATVNAMINNGEVRRIAWKELLEAKIKALDREIKGKKGDGVDEALLQEDEALLNELLAAMANGYENKN